LGASYCSKHILKGGTCVFVHKSIIFCKISINNHCLDHDTEISGVKLEMAKPTIYIFLFIEHPQAISQIFY